MKAVAFATAAAWLIAEIAVGCVRRSARSGAEPSDRASLRVLLATMALGVATAVAASRAGLVPFSGDPTIWQCAGTVLMVAGILVRALAIGALGRFFTVDVSIAPDHRLVETGLYRRVRHPAYLGTLVSFTGLGLALGSWASLVLLLVPIGAAFVYRMRVEERALEEAFGEPYRAYRARTRRLIPWIY